ncbi:hypothetical protein ACHAXN_011646 [Cyclotella atomus]
MTNPKPRDDTGMNSKYRVPLERIPPLPFADSKMMEVGDKRETIMSPPAVKRTSELKLPTSNELPGTPSTAATISTFDLMNSVQKLEKTNMEVTITVLSLDGLIAKKDEPKERSAVMRELSSLSSHGLSLSKHGLSRLASHGSSVRELLSRHSSHSSKGKSPSMKDGMSRHSSHSSKEKQKVNDGPMSLSSQDNSSSDAASSESNDSSSSSPEIATIVASFSHSLTQKNVLFTHLPSHPMELETSTTIQPIAYWSSKVDLDDADQALSTLKFKRPFVKKDDSILQSKSKFVPQTCPIKLSVARNGKMISIGSADIIIHGTEDGDRTISSPVRSIPNVSKSILPLSKISFPMSRAKGDTISFGLRPDAKLRVLVHVSEPNVPVPPARDLEPQPQHDFPIKEVMESSMYDSPIKSMGEPVENKTDSNCTEEYSQCDDNSTDEEVWEEYVVEDNELRHLREQLVKSENSNKILKQEIAECHDALQIENEKYDQFCNELETVKQIANNTIESLREELHIARCEAVMLPVYETRISELLEELKIKDDALKQKDNEIKEKDDEIACLRDEIQEIRTGFRSQVDALSQVDSLLWDNDDQSTQTSTTVHSQQSQLKTDQWLAANMKEEWTGLKNAIIRSSRKLTSKEGGAAVKSVKWNDEDEKKSEEDKSTEDGSEEIKLDESLELVEENPSSVEEQMVSDDSLKLIEEELMSDEDPAAISDEEA